jgi:hypothetical protein
MKRDEASELQYVDIYTHLSFSQTQLLHFKLKIICVIYAPFFFEIPPPFFGGYMPHFYSFYKTATLGYIPIATRLPGMSHFWAKCGI